MPRFPTRVLVSIVIGLILSACQKDNLPPISLFTVSPHQGDSLTVFYFDARETFDPESPDFGIQIRWDWDGDSNWDTEYAQQKEYAERFKGQGQRIIIMEAVDPHGLISQSRDTIYLYEDNPFLDTLTDPRDGQKYSTARINGYWIMTDNLSYGMLLPDSIAQTNNEQVEYYGFMNSQDNLAYGGLYTWDEALDYEYKPGLQGICPPGWHIPEVYEWEKALAIFPLSGIGLNYYMGPDSPSGFNLNFYGMMNFITPGDSTLGYYYEGTAVAYWCSDKPIKILQDPDEYIQRIVFQKYFWSIVPHLYKHSDYNNHEPIYTYASYIRCFKDKT